MEHTVPFYSISHFQKLYDPAMLLTQKGICTHPQFQHKSQKQGLQSLLIAVCKLVILAL